MLNFQKPKAFWLVPLGSSQCGYVKKLSTSWKIVSTVFKGFIVRLLNFEVFNL